MNDKRKKSPRFFHCNFYQKNRRGLSTIIVTLILILLSLVAVGIVWVVVSNILQSGAEQTFSGLGQLTLSLSLENVKVESNGDVSVTVKRNAGTGDLSGIDFIVSDGENSQVIKKSESLGELATKTFTITSAELTDVAFVKEVSIAPISGTTGNEKVGSVVDKKEFTKKQVLQNFGAVSWWKLDGNAQDEIGGNSGTLQGDVNFVDGKFGKAGNFDENPDVMSITSIPLGSSYAIATWFQYPFPSTASWNTLTRGSAGDHQVIVYTPTKEMGIYDNVGGTAFHGSGFITSTLSNGWHHLAAVGSGTSTTFYIDGTLRGTSSFKSSSQISYVGNYQGGTQQFGQIDEVMIFNKALTDKQVKALYEMDLS